MGSEKHPKAQWVHRDPWLYLCKQDSEEHETGTGRRGVSGWRGMMVGTLAGDTEAVGRGTPVTPLSLLH